MYISFNNTPGDPGDDAAKADATGATDEAELSSEAGAKHPRGLRTVSSTVITLGIVSMLTDISSESVSAVLPLYITGVLGLSTIAFGVIDGLYQGVSAFVRIAAGYASDRSDQPKWIAFIGYGLSAIARVGLLFVTGFGALTAVIMTDRIGKGIRTAPRDSLITATSRPDNLGAAFGVHRTLDNIGAAVGPLLAFFILLLIPDGYEVIFAASLAFAVIGVAILGFFVPNTKRVDAAAPPAAKEPRKKFAWGIVLRGPMRRVLAGAGILGLLTIGDGFVYLVLQSRSDFAAQWFPLLYVGTNVVFLACAIPMGKLADRVGRARVFVFGHVGLLAAYVVAALPIADIASTLLCLVFLGAFYASTDGVLAALAAQLTTPDTRGTGIAAAQTVVAISRLFAATGFGILWFTLGREQSMYVVAGLLVIAVIAVAILFRPFLSSTRSLTT